jgi:hypothetical protein
LKTGQRADGQIVYESAMVKDLLELGCGLRALAQSQIRLTPHVGREEGTITQLVRLNNLKKFNGFGCFIAVERDLRVKCWDVVEPHKSVFRETLGQIVGHSLRPSRIPC